MGVAYTQQKVKTRAPFGRRGIISLTFLLLHTAGVPPATPGRTSGTGRASAAGSTSGAGVPGASK